MMQISPKQQQSLIESNAKINVWEGSVRSGKTYISLWRFLKELAIGPPGEYCIISRTYDSFKRNILPLLTKFIGSDAKYFAGKREMIIWGKTIHIVGADDARSESKIRGSTFSGAYVDEATIIPESSFKMLLSRCAMGGAKIFATTNPDGPYHWLKKDFLTDNPDVKSWKFTLQDNPQLTDEEAEYLTRQYKGVWYKRFIEGEWVQAEGAIYDFFDTSIHVINHPPGAAEYHIAGVDYGTTNACSFVLVGVNRNRHPNVWVEDVYYYDSQQHQRQKTDSEYAADLIKFISGKQVRAIYVDPSAASFKLELRRSGVDCLYDAENDVVDGIRFVSDYLSNGTLKICQKCIPLIKEIQGYVWDARSAIIGQDKPLKVNDHCLIGSTMVLTDKGPCRMDQLEPRGQIVAKFSGSVGLTHYHSARKTMTSVPVYRLTLSSGHTIVSTDTHRFLTQNGWKLLRDIEPEDKIYVWDGFYREESWARLGIDMSSGDAYGLMTAKQQLIALYAALSILREQNSSVFAAMRVRVSIVAKSIEIAIKGCARSAEKLLMWISTKISCAALVSAECFTLEAVESIEPAGHDDVYCMNVPLFKNFVANGMVVHNSVDALRYCIYTHFFSKPEQRLTPRELDDMYNDAMGINSWI